MSRCIASLLAGAAFLLPNLAAAQRYEVTSVAEAFRPLPLDNQPAEVLRVNVGTIDDGGHAGYPLPFPFRFFGELQDTINISGHGYVTFGDASVNANNVVDDSNDALTGTTDPDGMIAAWWDDSTCPADTGLQAQVLGQAPARQLVIQWSCHHLSDANARFDVQLWLAEGSSTIRVKYGAIGSGTHSATMGVAAPDGSSYVRGLSSSGGDCSNTCDDPHFPVGRTLVYAPAPTPDLVAAVRFREATSTGGAVDFQALTEVVNVGGAQAAGVQWELYFSSDDVLDASDTPIHTHSAAETIPGDRALEFADAVSVPLPAGDVYVCVKVDSADAVVEANESNNTACSSISMAVAGADLIGSIDVDPVGYPGQPVDARVSIVNRGVQPVGVVRYRVYLGDPDEGATGPHLYEAHVDLSSGGYAAPIVLPVPARIDGTDHHALLIVNPGGLVDEPLDNNFSASPRSLHLRKPDLDRPELLSWSFGDGACFFGEPLRAEVALCNEGEETARGFVTSIFLSPDASISGHDFEVASMPPGCPTGNAVDCGTLNGVAGICMLGTCHFPCDPDAALDVCAGSGMVCDADPELPGSFACQNRLEVGECGSWAFDVAMPADDRAGAELSEGKYFFGVFADTTDAVNEIYEGNNLLPRATPDDAGDLCLYPGMDVLPLALSAQPAMAAGETAIVGRKFRNVGIRAGAVAYRYVLSSNEIVSAKDIALPLQSTGGDGTLSLQAGATQELSEVVRVPSFTAPGSYWLGVIVDPEGAARELDESNNTFVALGKVEVEPSALRILTRALPDARLGSYWSQQLVAAGGVGECAWSARSLPPGLTLERDGYLSGIPADEGVFTLDVGVRCGTAAASALLGLRVSPPSGPLGVTTSVLPPAVVAQPYVAHVVAIGGEPPYACSFAEALPDDLGIALDGCALKGAAVATGTFPFTVEVRDARGSVRKALELEVVEQGRLVITSTRFEEALAGEVYGGCVTASGLAEGEVATWTIEPGTYPSELAPYTENENASKFCLGGVPTACDESYAVRVAVRAGGQSDSATLPMSVVCDELELRTESLPSVSPGETVDLQLEADGGEGLRFALYGGRLPAGLALDAAGRIAGTVARDADPGPHNFIVELEDDAGGHGLAGLVLVVEPDVPAPPRAKPAEDGGCASAGGGFSSLAATLASLLGAGLRRRRAAVARAAALLLPAALVAVASTASAQYAVTGPIDHELRPLAGATQAPPDKNDDDWSSSADMWVVQLPPDFTFRYFGETWGFVHVGGNGAVLPSKTASPSSSSEYISSSNKAMPATAAPSGVIAPWWDDMARSATLSPHPGGLFHVVEGTAPHRVFKVEWRNLTHYNCTSSTSSIYNLCSTTRSYTFQLWIWEAAGPEESTLAFAYGLPIGPDGTPWGGEESGYAGSSSSSMPSATVGFENPAGDLGVVPIACGASGGCTFDTHWPTNRLFLFGEKAELSVAGVEGSPVGWAGVPMELAATVRNDGGAAAVGVGVRFYGSVDAVLSEDDVDLGLAAATADLAPGASATLRHTGAPPPELEAGSSYYVLAVADDTRAIDEDFLGNNVAAYGPFAIGQPTPDLIVESVEAPAELRAGEAATIRWVARNVGNAAGPEVPYAVVLSPNDAISTTDRWLAAGAVSVAGLASAEAELALVLPDDLPAGRHFVGIVLDPNDTLPELSELNNTGGAATPTAVFGGPLSVVSTALPPAHLSSHYCAGLSAAGGVGEYVWEVADGSSLPPGLSLVEEGPATLLCGSPSQAGEFEFDLEVTSGLETVGATFTLTVELSSARLEVLTSVLPTGAFETAYEGRLVAIGGHPPYAWALADGELPRGLVLGGDGTISGQPLEAGDFELGVEVRDASELRASRTVSLRVNPPARLRCVTAELPDVLLGEEVAFELLAAGGTPPYAWSTLESRRLSDGVADPGETLALPPAGLSLSSSGEVSGTAAAAGSYVWTVRVADPAGGTTDDCSIPFVVRADHGLTVLTTQLPVAYVGVPFSVALRAQGATGFARWRLVRGSSLPDGLELAPDGTLRGAMEAYVLEGAESRVFPFVVQVVDGQNRTGIAAMSVTLRLAPARAPEPVGGGGDEGGGCQAAAGGSGIVALLALGATGRRRRR